VKFLVSTLNQATIACNFSCKSACENFDAVNAQYVISMLFADNIAVEHEVIVATIMIALFIFTHF